MMTVASSPATEPRTTWRASQRPSPATSGLWFGIPRSPEEAGKLLSHAERLVRDGRMTPDYVRELTRFLGANSAAWTRTNRERLRRVLSALAEGVIDAVVATMSRLPRTDILDECELVLRRLPADAITELRRLVQKDERIRLLASVRATLLRAATRADERGSLATLLAALNDPEPEVRDAAAGLLGEIGEITSREALEKRLERETDDSVRASLREALDSIEE